MLEPTYSRDRDDLPHFAQLDRPLFPRVLFQSEVRSVFVSHSELVI